MSGVFPEAFTLEQFWQNIIHRKDACADIPEDRWKMRPEDVLSSRPAPDRAFHRRGCVVRNFHFNPDGFQVSAETLKSLDMLHHLALHTAREVLAPFQPSGMAWDRVGVIMASIALPTAASSHLAQEILGKSFENALFQKPATSSSTLSRHQCLAAQVTAFPAEILAKALGLGAFAFTLDAACASSIYAVKLACDALSSRRCDAVLAGGVSCPDRPYTQIGFSQLRALSPTGCCAPFDVRGDGLIVGEGAGILLLRRLEDAVADANPVLGIIRGIGLSNDMRGNLLAPDIEGQVRAMRAAYHSAGWRPTDVDIIECHGAGTPVGDAAELLSLKALWECDGNSASGAWGPSGRCTIGSVKSMIGHLLTAAGAAGIIKTLLALKHQMLPPSLNFQSPPENSPLNDGPFQVQTTAASWPRRADAVPRRAAVSAFGFGGINAHILLEEWMPGAESASIQTEGGGFRSTAGAAIVSADSENSVQTPPDIAVIGMDVCLGSLDTLRAFQEAVLSGISDIRKRPEDRWRGCDAIAASLGLPDLPGGYMESVVLELKDFHIPPHEIPDILIQHLLMLKVAGRAMQDAGLTVRQPRPRMGAIIGMGFDMEATDFHLRWNIGRFYKDWLHRAGISLNPADSHRWQESLKNACGPALTPSRTLGALAGVIASRVAREFGMGAPSFTVSGNAVSGVHALEAAVRLLQRHEADAMLVGAVDMACDVRNLLMTHGVKAFSDSGVIRPLDALADGALPGEGAAALVLKRRNQAAADGDRIYAVIKGVGSAMAASGDTSDAAYLKSLRQSLDEAGATPASIGMLEAHGSGHPDEDRMELRAFDALFQDSGANIAANTAVGSVKPIVGHTGAAAGMVSIVKTCLCLYQEIIPPLVNFQKPPALHLPSEPGGDTMGSRLGNPLSSALYFPAFPHYWVRNRQEGPRRACCAAISAAGACGHVVLEGCDNLNKTDAIRRERRAPLGNPPAALFVIEGESPAALLDGLRRFETHARQDFPSAEALADAWFHQHPPTFKHPYAVSFVAESRRQLPALIEDAAKAVVSETCRRITGRSGVAYTPQPLGLAGDIAFVFPGSGNHFVGMGRSVGIRWPEVLRQMDFQTPELKTQLIPEMYVPYRQFWTPGWEIEAQNAISASPLFPIFGQVLYGSVMTRVMRTLGLTPQAAIGYSLGETAGFFALNAWPDSGVMLSRLSESALFHTELTGPCLAARKAWGGSLDVPFVWKVAVVNRPAALVTETLPEFPLARLLIVNTPDECVIGGSQADVEGVIAALSCEAIYLDGVVTVHCDAAAPVQEAYRELHRFPTVQPPGIRFYSCAQARSISCLDTESAADSITRQAVSGFDFTATIRQAYQDGVRIFLEMGPHASCTRMIGRILGDSPHVAVSASSRGEDEYISILKLLATLASERIPVDLKSLYSRSSATVAAETAPKSIRTVIRRTGGSPFHPSFPEIPVSEIPVHIPASVSPVVSDKPLLAMYSSDMIQAVTRNAQADADAHQAFLSFSDEVIRSFGEGFAIQSGLLERQLSPALNRGGGTAFLRPMTEETIWPLETDEYKTQEIPDAALSAVAYSKEMCLEFAIGSVAKVLGPGFAEVDTYPARVRLPDAPLMLVDRILSVEGQKGSLGSGRIVTEHDVLPGAWYLDGGHAPVCIAVEAGQADLFLCAWLGIDLQVRGQRTYRLLDAAVQFHRGLPSVGDTIRYEIHIDRFVRQTDTWLFFFSFRGYIGQELLITMINGCAGFFTAAEVENSGGIILTDAERQPVSGKTPADWKTPVPMVFEVYNEIQVDALRSGNLSGCFGRHFSGVRLADSLRLPGGRMRLIDRILNLEPSGGRYGLGIIRAQADIHPDDWFLTCHFMDDPVMPGTLMYECCAHTLRVFIQRMGWISETPGVCYEPVPGVQSILKCRGPVTPHSRHVVYTIEIRELGYMPEPYVIADALMTADGHDIVLFRNISMKMTGVTRTEIESFWKNRLSEDTLKVSGDMVQEKAGLKSSATTAGTPPSWHVTRQQILSFCIGKPSDAFGEAFRPFDSGRFLARLPGPPYLFIDRVVHAEPPALVLKPGGWIVAEYDVSPSDWYFRADGTGVMPFAVLLEIALQPCGWLAAYAGSSLSSSKDLHFRNLGGTGMIHRDIFPNTGTLTMRCRMTRVSAAGDMIIEDFDFQVLSKNRMIYDGHTTFGFFTPEALKQQKGLRSAESWKPGAEAAGNTACRAYPLQDMPPFSPEDISESPDTFSPRLTQPARALRMMDVITCSISDGGPHGLGYIQGEKTIHPDEWFFQAHFYQDPVWPGSLGIEALMQLVKCAALDKWPECIPDHHFSLVTGVEHVWTYRGQVVPENRSVVVKAVITQQETFPAPLLIADGILSVDGLPIYEMNRFGIRILHNS